ncbi:MAG: hypothetical protein R2745_02210 [Vicinamibacterales bacterium]
MHTYVNLTPADDNAPAGKLADVELHFAGGELDGLKLVGFAVWTRRDGQGYSVTFPTRQFMARGGEKRNFSLVRAIENPEAERKLRDFILQAHAAYVPASETSPT